MNFRKVKVSLAGWLSLLLIALMVILYLIFA
jgi:hypothetical protein